ncbi:putative protein ydhF precursor [Planococcus halocryophilus Or1]|uniref:DUF4352 domain-containing protein n=1 Tax=Planococcus halocryophilus TaxID=1215089 RepID=A0A1C7DTM2_9BACL|nr:hypothetical protein [Planococcus halocryophilus]ANU14543.1 hypothetical protein BBI08_11950 [Planococcus halocryophilus]EMF46713.1 putative protein ydhF precursor [Planococcus halocryophilus Or1]
MKKAIYFLLFSAVILGGCSDPDDSIAVASTVAEESEVPKYYEDYVLSPQVTDDRKLQEVGQNKRDAKGEAIVEAINMTMETYGIGPVKLTVAESKILQVKPDYSLIDFFHAYTHDQEFSVVKMYVEITNTSNEPLHFAPVALFETDAEELKLWEDDIYLEGLTGEIAPGETKQGNIGFIVEESDIDSVTITTSAVFNKSEEKIAEALEFNTRFE